MLENPEKFELTCNQKNIYMTDIANGNSKVNNICGIVNINYDFDLDRVKKCILKVIKLNDAFRISLFSENGNIYQKLNNKEIIDNFEVQIVNEDFNIKNIEKEFFNNTISINDKQLYRFKIISINNKKGALLINLHHIISDAWSFSCIANEFIKFYEGEEVNENKISFFEYALEQKNYFASEKYENDRIFWQTYLKDIKNTISLKEGIIKNNNSASRFAIKLSKKLNENINLFCKENKISCYVLFLTALYTYIYRVLDKDDIIIGTPVLNRTNFKEKQIMGMFVSTLPLRIKINENMELIELAHSISSNTLEVFRHQKYPYLDNLEYVYKNTDIKNKLYNIVLSYQNARIDTKGIDKYSTEWYFLKQLSDELQIHIVDMDNTGNLEIDYDFLNTHFKLSEIKLIHLRILKIIEEFILNTHISIEDVDILSDKDKEIIDSINATEKKLNLNYTPLMMFKDQVIKRPNKLALIFKDKKYTYEQLDILSNKMANYLLNSGVSPKDRIGILLKRNESVVISILACLKLGIAYIPIDERYPSDRIEYILNNSKCKYVLSNTLRKINFNTLDISRDEYLKCSSDDIKYTAIADDICYIIYTSGSTGMPKGVVVTNKNVTNFLIGIDRQLKLKSSDNFLSQTTISFDIFELEVLLPLKNGMTIILADDDECINAYKLRKLCLNNKANVIQMTPSKLRLLLSQGANTDYISKFTKIILGGECVDSNLVKKIRKVTNSKIYDAYGPTETTIWSTIKEITNTNISCGRPIANTKIWVVDKKLRILPIHTKGQLVIGGNGVANGYFENDKKTNSSFVNTSFYNKKVYLTGDLCIINYDHDIEILNRIDNQIKINGQRIEIEEIESLILKNKLVKDVAISYRDDKHLVCFYSLKDTNECIDLNYVKKQLMNKLPLYMVPNFFIRLQSIPYTLNNKKDRKKIGMIDIKDYLCSDNEKIILPKNELQKDIYDSILKITDYDKLSIDTNIEELNIDSLDGIKIQIDLLKKGIILNYTELIRYKNIIGIYEHLMNDKIKNSDKNYNKLNDEYVDILNNTLSLKQENKKIKNVILTGLTGFLGVHILSKLIEGKMAEKIYCIVRKKGNTSIKNRVIELFNYYFDGKYIDQIDKKIILIDVDLLDKNFEEVLQNKTTNVNYFIHAAACVKHYGDDNYFKLINVDVTENIAKFCLKHDINLIHSSTLSISGNGFDIGINNELIESKVFDESSLYIGQNLDNVYAKTKFDAECVILKYMKKGLKANIIRYGNLTSRRQDLKFQKNVSDNGFVSRIRLLTLLKLVPKSQEDVYLEFTPIDEAASATNIIFENFIPNKIYHIYNNNHVALNKFIDILNKNFKFGINIVKDNEFSNSLKNIMDVYDDDIKSIVVQDIDENYMVNYKSNVSVKCNFTLKFLDKYKFKWKEIDEEYLINYIKYFIKNGYIC